MLVLRVCRVATGTCLYLITDCLVMSYPEEFATHLLGVGGVIIQDNQILLVKLGYGRANNYWLIPGGLVEKGETLEEALVREIKEETNLEIRPDGIIGIRSMVRKSDNATNVYTIFNCRLLSDPNNFKSQEDEIADISWIDIDQVETMDDVPSYTRKIISVSKKSKRLRRDKSHDGIAKERLGIEKYEQFWV